MKIFFLTIALAYAAPKEPTLRWKEGNTYIATNPLKQNVSMTVYCGQDFEKFVLDLLPRSQEEITITTPDGRLPVCTRSKWQKTQP